MQPAGNQTRLPQILYLAGACINMVAAMLPAPKNIICERPSFPNSFLFTYKTQILKLM